MSSRGALNYKMAERGDVKILLVRWVSILIISAGLGCALSQHSNTLQIWIRSRSVGSSDELAQTTKALKWEREKIQAFRQPGKEILISWPEKAIRLVKLEYRQVRLPEGALTKELDPKGRRWVVFNVPQEDLKKNGEVCAWRVTLWTEGGVCAAERNSATWR